MKVNEIYNYLNKIYPFELQESWDNSRLVINNPEVSVENIIVCLDINKRILDLAIQNNVQLIISHHPLFIDPPNIKNYHTRKIFGYLKKNNINLIFMHTNFDKSVFGMNTNLAFQLGLKNIRQSENPNDCYVIGDLEKQIPLSKFVYDVKSNLHLDEVKYASGFRDTKIRKVAICGGSGSDLIYQLKGADCLITGDVKYHTWVDSIDLMIPIIEINHNVENIFVDIITNKLLKLNEELNIIKIKAKINFKLI